MRQIGTIADERLAKRLADYLLTQEITTRVDATPAGYVIWVHREDKVELAKAELAAFEANPDDPKYVGTQAAARAIRKRAERTEKEHRRNTIYVQNQWASYRPLRRCPVMFALLGFSIAITLYLWMGNYDNVDSLEIGTLRPVRSVEDLQTNEHIVVISNRQYVSELWSHIRQGEVWRLVTPIFLHFGSLHLLFNMMWLYDIGGQIEIRRGSLRFAVFVLLAAVISNLGQYYYTFRPNFGGMSGVNYAFFGYLWMKGEYDPASGMGLRRDTIVWMLVWLVLCMTGAVGPVANAAHVVGLGVGIVCGVAPHVLKDLRWS